MKKWIIGVVVAVLLVVVGGPFVYFHFIEGEAPPKLVDRHVTARPRRSPAPTQRAARRNVEDRERFRSCSTA